MEDLTGEDLSSVAAAGSDSAAGMDQWAPAELKLLSPLAYQWMAEFLNEIEKCKSWPKEFNHGRAAFLAKTEDGIMDPLQHRVLVMLPAI